MLENKLSPKENPPALEKKREKDSPERAREEGSITFFSRSPERKTERNLRDDIPFIDEGTCFPYIYIYIYM